MSFLFPFGLLRRFFNVKAEEHSPEVDKTTSKGKVVVGGGTGFVGTELCRLLRRNHYDVVIVSRSKKEPTHPGDQRMSWDELSKSGLPHGTKAVVNLAGQNVLDPLSSWTPKFQQLVYKSRVETSQALRDAIVNCDPGQRPKVFVTVTGVGFYPPSQQTIYDESSPGGEHDFLARLVVDWESAGRIPKEVSDVRNVWIRSGVVLGRNGGLIGNIFWQFFFGLGGRMGSGHQPLAWIHVKDLAGLVHHSIENENVTGVLNGVAPQLASNQDFVDQFARSLNRPSFLPMPSFVWNFIFGPVRASMITEGQKVVPKRTLETGFQYRFPTLDRACFEFSHAFYKDSDEN